MILMEIIQACEARIVGGSEFLWQCYGPNARYLDFADRDGTECVSVVFDIATQQVCELQMNVPGYDQAFGWRASEFEQAYQEECKAHNIEPNIAWDDLKYERVDSTTALSYAKDIIGTYYDNLPVPEVA